MNIALLCRWKLNNVLTVSTVMPHLQVLIQLQDISKIVFLTLEDATGKDSAALAAHPVLMHEKIEWFPVSASQTKSRLVNQVADFILGCKKLRQVVSENNIDVVIAHGAPAGALAYKVWQQTKVPFFVSSFEPHADYMLESGVWSRFGLKYRYQKHWEDLLKKRASGVMPVSESYRAVLQKEGVAAEKIFVVPCAVEAGIFMFDAQQRSSLRQQFGWQKALVGIYVGKYGGLYYQEEAFGMYKKCFQLFPDFRLLILSPQPKEQILKQLQQQQIDTVKVYVASAPHQHVPAYLSAADFAFATYKQGASKRYLSPVKIGEYWANGLPVLLTVGVGDDSGIINNEGGGAVFNLQQEGSLEQALQQITTILETPDHRQEIPKLALKYRSPARIREAYEYFFGCLTDTSQL